MEVLLEVFAQNSSFIVDTYPEKICTIAYININRRAMCGQQRINFIIITDNQDSFV